MPDIWYSTVEAGIKLTQGDLILDCPLIRWKAEPPQVNGSHETEILKQSSEGFSADTVVMT